MRASQPTYLTTTSAARRVDRSEATIRNWTKAGHLTPVTTTPSGVRLYDPADVDRAAAKATRNRAKTKSGVSV